MRQQDRRCSKLSWQGLLHRLATAELKEVENDEGSNSVELSLEGRAKKNCMSPEAHAVDAN